MTVTPRTQAQDERFIDGARMLGPHGGVDALSMDGGFVLVFFAIILVYIFARALWGLIKELNEEHKPGKEQRVTTTPKHYPK